MFAYSYDTLLNVEQIQISEREEQRETHKRELSQVCKVNFQSKVQQNICY